MKSVPMCLFALGMIGLFLGSQFVKLKKGTFSKFKSSLSLRQQLIYQDIIKERANIFIFSLLSGITVALGTSYLWWSNNDIKTPLINLSCYFISVSLFVCYILYMLMPKSKYILNYLDQSNQVDEWLIIYKKFRNANYIGLVLGCLLFFTISSFRYKNS